MDTTHSISLKETWNNIKADLIRYRLTEKRSYIAILIMSPGLIAVLWYRLGHWLWRYNGRFASLLRLLRPPYIVLRRIVEIISGIYISPRATIGAGMYIAHFGCVYIGEVEIGENCNLAQEVTLGVAGRGERHGLPTIGDRVLVAPGVKILGKLNVGNDVAIGANAVVTKSVPDRAVVVGIPAHVISYEGSFEFIFYDGIESDAKRNASLALRGVGDPIEETATAN